jgi:hypothetical protein
MAVTLGAYVFSDVHTAWRDKEEEVGGRDERLIELSGIIAGRSSIQEVEAALDAILDAASVADYSAALSLREGRRLMVRREAFVREVAHDPLVGSFTLKLKAKSPYEEAVDVSTVAWSITAPYASVAVTPGGTVFALPAIQLTAGGSLVNPSVSDGVRTATYEGVVEEGSVLVFDAPLKSVRLDGEDVTPYMSGLFPRIEPEGTTLVYADDASSAHQAEGLVVYRTRWW